MKQDFEKIIDFSRGNIVRNIVLFAMPIVAGELLQNLYNSVDALFVGNFVSDGALAAVTVSGVISNMIVSFFNGMSVGANVVVSQAFGEGDKDLLNRKICATFTFSTLLGVLLSFLGICFAPQLLKLAGAQDSYYADALTYLRIYLAGLMFTVVYNNGAGILRAVGDSNTPFRILAFTCGANIILDWLFVVMIPLGVAGVGLATLISQGISVGQIYRAINRKQGLCCFNLPELRHNGRKTIISVLRVGMAAGMQSALICFSNIFVVRYMNLFDTASVAGIGVAQRLDKFILLPAKSFGITITTFVSQNIGAGHYERLREGKTKCLLIAVGMTLSISVLVGIFSEQCVALFNGNPDVISVGVSMIRMLLPFFPMMAIREVYLGILRGNGKNAVPMVLSLIGMVGVRQAFLAAVMHTAPKIEYIFFCYPLAWIATVVLLLGYYLIVRRHLPSEKNAHECMAKR